MYSCSECGFAYMSRFSDPVLIACPGCGNILKTSVGNVSRRSPPDDWSFIQIGTKGVYNQQHFEVTGRIRLQLRNEYKNYWCIAYNENSSAFLYESFGSLAILDGEFKNYQGDVRKLKAGHKIKHDKSLVLTGEFVEKCESITYEGEVGNWKEFQPGFFIVQAGTSNGWIATYRIVDSSRAYYYLGNKSSLEKLKLEKIREWDEWK